MTYHKPYTNKQEKIEKRLEEIRKTEQVLIKKVDIDIKKRMHTRRAYFEVMHFTFNDFAQVTIGSCVFSFAPFLDTDP